MTTIINFGPPPHEDSPVSVDSSHILAVKTLKSTTHSLARVVEITKRQIMQAFPDDYFKHVFVGTEMSSVARTEKGHDDIRSFRKLSPALAIIPTYVPHDSLMGNEPLDNYVSWKDGVPVPTRDWESLLCTFFYHDTLGRKAYNNVTRVKVSFEVAIRVGTELRAWDLVTMLRKTFRPGYFYYVNRQIIPVEMPHKMTKAMAIHFGFDPTDTASAGAYVSYLDRFSRYRIYADVNPATGLRGVMVEFPTNLLYRTDGDWAYDKNTIGKSQEKTLVTNTITCEFTLPDTFILRTHDDVVETMTDIGELGSTIDEEVLTLPLHTKPTAHMGNRSLQMFRRFVTDVNVSNEVVDLSETVHPTMRDFLRENFLHGGVPNNAAVVVWYGRDILTEPADYAFDWVNMRLTVPNPLYNYVYHVAIYADNTVVKNYIDSVANDQYVAREVPS